jgi:hypothetical protein
MVTGARRVGYSTPSTCQRFSEYHFIANEGTHKSQSVTLAAPLVTSQQLIQLHCAGALTYHTGRYLINYIQIAAGRTNCTTSILCAPETRTIALLSPPSNLTPFCLPCWMGIITQVGWQVEAPGLNLGEETPHPYCNFVRHFREKGNIAQPLSIKFRDWVCKNTYRISFPGNAKHLPKQRYYISLGTLLANDEHSVPSTSKNADNYSLKCIQFQKRNVSIYGDGSRG